MVNHCLKQARLGSLAGSVPASREERRHNSIRSLRFTSSALVPGFVSVSSSPAEETQSQTSMASIRNHADQTDIGDTVAFCHEYAEYCLEELSP